MTSDDLSRPANISLRQSLLDFIDEDIIGKTFKNRSEYISYLVEREKQFGKYDRFIEAFGTIYYPLIIFLLFFSFSVISIGIVQLLFFLLAVFTGLILTVLFFLSYFRHKHLKEKKNGNNNR